MYVETRAGVGDFSHAPQSIPQAKVTLGKLPEGRAGTLATLKAMRNFARASIDDPSQRIRRTAIDIFRRAGIAPRNYIGEIRALHAFVRDHIRYMRDPVDRELVQDPATTLDLATGDCDDKSTLLGALLTASGHPSKFLAVGMNGGPLSHVLVETKYNTTWIPLETIIYKPMGWFPPGVTDRLPCKI